MKKLMFAVSAALCATVGFSDVTSANIVGYNNISDGGYMAPGIGAMFLPINGAETYKLKELKVEVDEDGMPMFPDDEFLQLLDPDTTWAVEDQCYTYVSKKYVDDNYSGTDEYDLWISRIGWWVVGHIGEDGYKKDEESISCGQAMLGYLFGNEIKFVSSGSVPLESTWLSDNYCMAPFFFNYLPCDKQLGDFTMSAYDDESMPPFPDDEFLQVLDPDTTWVADGGCLTYVSPKFVEDNYAGTDDYELWMSRVGWWEAGHIGEDGYSQTTRPVKAGDSFLGYLFGNDVKFNIPAAIDQD